MSRSADAENCWANCKATLPSWTCRTLTVSSREAFSATKGVNDVLKRSPDADGRKLLLVAAEDQTLDFRPIKRTKDGGQHGHVEHRGFV